jgi:hypothetical protein
MQTAYSTQVQTINKQVYDEFISGKSVNSIRKLFGLTKIQIDAICTDIFNKQRELIRQVKSDHPQTENVDVLDLENLMCASFTHLTVGDCVIDNGQIVDFKNLYNL